MSAEPWNDRAEKQTWRCKSCGNRQELAGYQTKDGVTEGSSAFMRCPGCSDKTIHKLIDTTNE